MNTDPLNLPFFSGYRALDPHEYTQKGDKLAVCKYGVWQAPDVMISADIYKAYMWSGAHPYRPTGPKIHKINVTPLPLP